jgi:hypothetical protein
MYRIVKNFKTLNKYNPVSGHSWSVPGSFIGWSVTGGRWITTNHRSLAAAEKEVKTREGLDRILQEHYPNV